MRNSKRLMHLLRHEQDRHAFPIQMRQNLHNHLYQHRRQTKRWFIEHEQLWARHERPPDGDHLLFTAAQGAGILPPAFLQTWKETIDTLDGLVALRTRGGQVGAEFQVFNDAHLRKQRTPFGNLDDPAPTDLMRRQAGNVFAHETD